MRPVRVNFHRRMFGDHRGYDIVVLDAHGELRLVYDGWTAGDIHEARREFANLCRVNGWVERDMRTAAMRGAA